MTHADTFTRNGLSNRQAGLSLVELMIASALGLIIVAALTQLFADVTKNNREMAKTNSQIENARFAMQFLRNDIVHAGYWGEHLPEFNDLVLVTIPTDKPTIVPDPCLAYSSWNTTTGHINSLLGVPVQAYEDSPSTACDAVVNDELVPALPAGVGTDVLVVRHAEQCIASGPNANCPADVAGKLYFQASNCVDELDAGDLYQLDPNSFPLTERDCITTAGKRRFVQNIYYIRDYAVTAGDGIPTLVRSEFDLSGGSLQHNPAQSLVQGIERFRVELGIDNISEAGTPVNYDQAIVWQDPDVWNVATNRGDGVPDGAFVHCSVGTPCTVEQLRDVVAVKLYVLARADEPTLGYVDTKQYQLGGLTVPPFNDNFKRHVFSTTVRINNVAGRRETP